MARIKVTSNGILMLTKIADAETGQPIAGVVALRIEGDVRKHEDGVPRLHLFLEVDDFDMEFEADATVTKVNDA